MRRLSILAIAFGMLFASCGTQERQGLWTQAQEKLSYEVITEVDASTTYSIKIYKVEVDGVTYTIASAWNGA